MLPSYVTFKEEIEQIENYMQSIKYYNEILKLDISELKNTHKEKRVC